MFIYFDIGGTTSRFASSIDGRKILDTKIEPTPQKLDEAILLYKKMVDELSVGQKIDAMAGGVPGPLNSEKTMLLNAPHLRSWTNKPLNRKFKLIADCSVYFENDTALAALGEANQGAGVGSKIIAYIAIGTGVGGARVVNGKIDFANIGFEPGHMIVGSGRTLEQMVSGTTIMKTYHTQISGVEDPNFWHEFEESLVAGLNNIAVMWSPDIIILGGGVGQEPKVSVDRIMLSLYKTLTIYPSLPKLVKAILGDRSALIGASIFLKQKLGTSKN